MSGVTRSEPIKLQLLTVDHLYGLASDHTADFQRYREAREPQKPGKPMSARFAGKCADCGADFPAGHPIVYDGKPHHTTWDECQAVRDLLDSERAAKAKQALEAIQEANVVLEPKAEAKEPVKIREGLFTVVSGDERRTFRVRKQPADRRFAPGEYVVSYLSGSDNEAESSYQGFAFLRAEGMHVWRRFAGFDSTLLRLARVLVDPEAAAAAGEAYALESGRCYRCNHTLTVPASIHRGLGPECARLVG